MYQNTVIPCVDVISVTLKSSISKEKLGCWIWDTIFVQDENDSSINWNGVATTKQFVCPLKSSTIKLLIMQSFLFHLSSKSYCKVRTRIGGVFVFILEFLREQNLLLRLYHIAKRLLLLKQSWNFAKMWNFLHWTLVVKVHLPNGLPFLMSLQC